MGLRIYNTAVRDKQEFIPVKEGSVGMYVCGVTVYDLCHIGHARSAIVFDVLARYLRARGYKLTYVRNFTDIDDKIINRAKELKKDTKEIAEYYIQAFYEDMGRLYVEKADYEPRATEFIDEMIDMVKILLEKGHAYVSDGDVYFSVESFPEYGALSKRKLEDMIAGKRVKIGEKKRHPMDFALWKAAKPGEPYWKSPWGDGRPGWHLECSVMSCHYLGPTFDIHGGGEDLIFPHHENERAQAICAYGGDFARYWVHNGFVTVESEKMSKSLGNFITIRDVLKLYHPQVIRLFLLSRHYKSPLDFSKDAIRDIKSALIRAYRTLERLEEILGPEKEIDASIKDVPEDGEGFLSRFVSIMNDDLNTAGAIGLIFEKIREINRKLEEKGSGWEDRLRKERKELLIAGKILGLFKESPSEFFKEIYERELPIDISEIERMIKERQEARKRKDWETADRIRDKLRSMGIILEDTPKGTRWRLDV